MVVDEAATAVVQIASPALVLVAVTICAHLARLLVDVVGAPPGKHGTRRLSLAFNLAVPCLAVLCRPFGVSSGHGTATA
jgi:hypothetical protein